MQLDSFLLILTCTIGFCAGLVTARNLFRTEVCHTDGFLFLFVSLTCSCIYALTAAFVCGLFPVKAAFTIVVLLGFYSTAKSSDFKQSVAFAINHIEANAVITTSAKWWANRMAIAGLNEKQTLDFCYKLMRVMAVATYKTGKYPTIGRTLVDQAAANSGISTSLLDRAFPVGTVTRLEFTGKSRKLIAEIPGCEPQIIEPPITLRDSH
jgi:hypothetical protein